MFDLPASPSVALLHQVKCCAAVLVRTSGFWLALLQRSVWSFGSGITHGMVTQQSRRFARVQAVLLSIALGWTSSRAAFSVASSTSYTVACMFGSGIGAWHCSGHWCPTSDASTSASQNNASGAELSWLPNPQLAVTNAVSSMQSCNAVAQQTREAFERASQRRLQASSCEVTDAPRQERRQQHGCGRRRAGRRCHRQFRRFMGRHAHDRAQERVTPTGAVASSIKAGQMQGSFSLFNCACRPSRATFILVCPKRSVWPHYRHP